MSIESKRIVDKAWNFATVLWHDGVPFLAYTEEITFLLFLKMADELTKPPYNRPAIVPPELGWPSLLSREGEALKRHYDHILQELARKQGMLGDIFKRAKSAIEKPETLRRLIVDLIDPEKWVSMDADVKGDVYEGLLARSMSDGGQGAGNAGGSAMQGGRSVTRSVRQCRGRPSATPLPKGPSLGNLGRLEHLLELGLGLLAGVEVAEQDAEGEGDDGVLVAHLEEDGGFRGLGAPEVGGDEVVGDERGGDAADDAEGDGRGFHGFPLR
jgi:hypothetical protein